MPTAIENTGMSTSEEKLPVNGSFSASGSVSPVDEPRIFVFVEKNPGESLGLYLVPFEDEPLTGLYVKTIVTGKAAARLQVFDPGDKIVSVNGKSLSGLTYRESTDFIRQCSGPNVKMGIIKHALYKKEDLVKLDSMSVFQHHSGVDVDVDVDVETSSSGGGASTSLGYSGHAPAARLSQTVPKTSIGGSGVKKEMVIEAPLVQASPDVSYNVESTPDFSMDFGMRGKNDDMDLSGGMSAKGGVDTNANFGRKAEASGENIDIDFTAPEGIFDTDGSAELGASGTTEDIDSDSSVENRPSQKKHRKSSKTPRRSRSNPQIRSRPLAEYVVGTRPIQNSLHSPNQRPSPGKEVTIAGDYHFPAYRAGNPCAVAMPLSQKSPDINKFSYLIPLSDQPRSPLMEGNAKMIKSKSLDKLDEIMRNDPILGEDYLGSSSSSKSTQTQTDAVYKRKKSRRKRNDRPRSQILPPTYLQLPSVTWLPNALDRNENQHATRPSNESPEVPTDYYLSPNYPRATQRRRSKEEQAQIVQRWIDEMIEHKKAQELRRQNFVRRSVGRERSTKLKKKSRSVPEHTFRGNQSKFDRRRGSDNSEEANTTFRGIRHADSDPSLIGRALCAGTVSAQTVGNSTDERISPSLQSRIRSLEESFQQNNASSSCVQSNNPLDQSRPNRNELSSSPGAIRRSRVSNPDLPLISHLLSGGEVDSQC